MVVRLVLEHEEPVLILAVHIHRNADAGRIDLLRLIEIIEFALGAQRLHPDDGNVHERHITLSAVLIECPAIVNVALVGLNDRQPEEAALNVHRIDRCGKGRMAAMIGPVGIDHAQFGNRRCAVLRVAEILLNEFEIRIAHGKAAFCVEQRQLAAGQLIELRKDLHVRGHCDPRLERRRHCQRCLAALYGIDEICLDLIADMLINFPNQDNDACRSDIRALSLRHKLNAFRRRSSRRVKLTRQRLNRKDVRVGKGRQRILIHGIHRRIGKDNIPHTRKVLIAEALNIIACDDAHGTQIRQAERLYQIAAEPLCRNIEEPLPLLYKDSFDSHTKPLPLSQFLLSILAKSYKICNGRFSENAAL